MKFRSILSVNPKLRTNAVFCLIFAIISSILTLISSVRIQPKETEKAIWNTQSLFYTCSRDIGHNNGVLKWFKGDHELDYNADAPVYQADGYNQDKKLYIKSASQKYSGTYECKHIQDGQIISSDKFDLKVFNAIDMEGNKESYIGTEGGPFSMTCSAKFDADSYESVLQWYHNNNQIKNGEGNYSTTSVMEQSVDFKKIRSSLTIKHLTKEDEGVYGCQSVFANTFLTDMKSIDITLRVQFKPRFLENTQKNVWISDETISPIRVNVTCAVTSDPIAEFRWYSGHIPIDLDMREKDRYPSHTRTKTSITESENLSVLTLEYQNIDEIRSNEQNGKNKRFECKARNNIGETAITFELNVGKLPETPILANYSYINGVLLLTVNESKVEPQIDIYRLEIADNHHIYFNASNRIANTNKYEVVVEVPSGVHNMILLAHNPVGWSEGNSADPPLQLVISSASVAQQYIGFVLFASTLCLVNTLF